ncbi:hypothetical protein [Nocardia sp. NPDC057668]|uniref:hypothetical protein n=1 Tax=Nocardia sp. NPDC057668 TaxID=3346202 RepID=UPI00366F90F2
MFSHVPQPDDPRRLVYAIGAVSAVGTLNAVHNLVEGYDALRTGVHLRSHGIDWVAIGAKVAIPLSLALIVLLCWAMTALCRHRSTVRVLVLIAAPIAVVANICEELFEWLDYNQVINPGVESRVIGAAVGSILPVAVVVMVTRPLLREWFVPPGVTWFPPRVYSNSSVPQADPVAPAILAGVAAFFGVFWAGVGILGGIASRSNSYPVDLAQSILGVVQVALLSGGALAVLAHHRVARPLLAAAAVAAVSCVLTVEIAELDGWSDYRTPPKQVLDFFFEVAIQVGPAVAAAVLILLPQTLRWFTPRGAQSPESIPR